jgi:SAM-dependent methyltransferase
MCPACGSAETRPLFDSAGHTYRACVSCGSARLAPMPAIDPASLYSADYFVGGTVAGGYADYGKDEALHRRNAVDRLERVAGVGLAPPGRIIEIGSGYGYFLDEARRAGWDVTGTDVSAHARDRAAGIGLDVQADLGALHGSADVLAAFQVLEHMLDPAGALADGIRLLRAGGLVIAESWDRSYWMARALGRRWQQVSPPAVVHLFTTEGLGAMALRLGLVDIEVHPTPKFVSLGAVAGHLATGRPRLKPTLDRVGASSLGRRPIKYGFGDLVTLTARVP